jgi:arginine-tRNA-protein transferase
VSVTTSVKAPPSGFGSFHQQYRIDGRLVAVGVVDVLPLCMSSKYCFWEPSLKALALGKLSSLREMDWVRAASTHCPTLRFYYMGFYIHTCPKMRYKADYKPSELKCPVRGAWVDFDGVAKHRLNSGIFGPLATAPAAADASTAAAREGRSAGADDGATGRAEAAASSREEEEEEEETDDARTESITLGLVAGNQVVECAALSRVAPGLPCAAVAALRHKLRRWRAQAGPVHEHIVYLVHIDQLGMEVAEEGDEDEDVDVEGADEDDEDEDDDDDDEDEDEEGSADMHV